ncbi:hypothetical protein BGZ74_010581 [Mortierella antarctica]|nr:hypothetical protein BGZ74_010581 [Mortierella antarctica]
MTRSANTSSRSTSVDWDVKHVKYRMINARRKHDAARGLSEFTGGGETRDLESLRKEMLALCPPFGRLHAVWGGTLARDPPPPRETCNRRNEEYFNKKSSPEVIETDEEEEEEDATGVEDEDQATERPAKRGQPHAKSSTNKRRKQMKACLHPFRTPLQQLEMRLLMLGEATPETPISA